MGLLSIFSGKAPENHEQKGDALFEANAYGKAVVEYQRALIGWVKRRPRMTITGKILRIKFAPAKRTWRLNINKQPKT